MSSAEINVAGIVDPIPWRDCLAAPRQIFNNAILAQVATLSGLGGIQHSDNNHARTYKSRSNYNKWASNGNKYRP